MPAFAQRLVIGVGSESGNAQALAEQLARTLALDAFSPVICALNDVSLADWDERDILLVLSSSFGDGEPPANAEVFLAHVLQTPILPNLRYAIFGLGDTAYPHFCGFTKQLDQVLQERHAQSLINRVDADASYPVFFAQWLSVLERVLQGDSQAGQNLLLRVQAYGESNAFMARILECKRLDQSPADNHSGAYHVRLDVAGSGMAWQAGDTLHVLPENAPELLQALAVWYGVPSAVELLRCKELRQISKTVLRELARLGGSEYLKGLLKFSQKKALDEYLWNADILDVLEDFCTPDNVPLPVLADMLSERLPRAYSIASPGGTPYMDLCIREVTAERKGRLRHGMATHWLLSGSQTVQVYCRSNPGFHLPADGKVPLILVGTGTGIAPLMGLLREMQATGQKHEACLIFGEKHRHLDFLYEAELQALQDQQILGELLTAFSRDGATKYYVQDAIAERAEHLRQMLNVGAHIYVCGNKAHLEKAVISAFEALTEPAMINDTADSGEPDALPQSSQWQLLHQQGRVHLELY